VTPCERRHCERERDPEPVAKHLDAVTRVTIVSAVVAMSHCGWGCVVPRSRPCFVGVLVRRRMMLVFVPRGVRHDAFGSHFAACVMPAVFACSLNAGMT
jgi:hypothetical protein